VESAVAFECICDAIKGISASNGIMESLSIRSGPRLFSILRGHKGGNLLRLQSLYPKAAIRFTQDAALPDHIISIRTGSGRGKEITYPDPC
jgi:hypothetical protein